MPVVRGWRLLRAIYLRVLGVFRWSFKFVKSALQNGGGNLLRGGLTFSEIFLAFYINKVYLCKVTRMSSFKVYRILQRFSAEGFLD